MVKAVIDLGTNTFNLLIAEVFDSEFHILHSSKIGVALGMGGILKKQISEDAFSRGLKALAEFKAICDTHGVQSIRAFGTSALRDATNTPEFSRKVKEELNLHIEIIDGIKEAELIYSGVKLTYSFDRPAMIMDIGGGSTEFIFANRNGIEFLTSLNIGVSRLFQDIPTSDPLSKDDIEQIENWLHARTDGFFENRTAELLIGASGTFETFYELIFDRTFDPGQATVSMTREQLEECLEKIICSTQAQRDLNDRIISIRKKMAPVSAVKTRWVLEKLKTKEILISPYSLKEGALVTA
ncbi:MAG: hypothetical protein RIT43_2352 [Bacteroidota bacterium]|jgi:exopolyphosphatase/guanosine-5'-triphosphate,3'-diphosphate pyrophosphatase